MVSIPKASATRHACCPPAPPKHCKAYFVTSYPLWTEIFLIALAMLDIAIRKKPSAKSIADIGLSPVFNDISSANSLNLFSTTDTSIG